MSSILNPGKARAKRGKASRSKPQADKPSKATSSGQPMTPEEARQKLADLGYTKPPTKADIRKRERTLVKADVVFGQHHRATTAWTRATLHVATMVARSLSVSAYADWFGCSQPSVSRYIKVAKLSKPTDDDSAALVLDAWDGSKVGKGVTLERLANDVTKGLLRQRTPGKRKTDHERITKLLEPIFNRKSGNGKAGFFQPNDRESIIRFVADLCFPGEHVTIGHTRTKRGKGAVRTDPDNIPVDGSKAVKGKKRKTA